MKNIFLIGLILLITSCKAQEKRSELTYENFDQQILNYEPVQNDVSKSSYQDALKFLDETQNRIRKNKKADISDYWNIITVFDNLNESNANIDIAFKKFISEEKSCEYVISFENYFDRYNEYIKSKLNEQLRLCHKSDLIGKDEPLDIKQYAKTNNLDEDLLKVIYQIDLADQKDRYNDEVQNKLDIKNQKRIDSLYSKHKTYIGKNLVGEKFEHVMWLVIQHSNLELMEKYLPVIHTAVKENEINETPLKMLIDRIYSSKYNYQIFGSQEGVKMAEDEIRKRVKMEYGVE